MPEPELFLIFVRPLNRTGIRYVVSGSVAAIFYGEPRLTHDVDFVVFPERQRSAKAARRFSGRGILSAAAGDHAGRDGAGTARPFQPHPPRHWFQSRPVSDRARRIERLGFPRQTPVEFEGETIVLAPPEYVIVRKLEYFREGQAEKHLRDIRAMLAVSGGQLDRVALNEWIQRRGLAAEWRLVSAQNDGLARRAKTFATGFFILNFWRGSKIFILSA